MQPLINVTVVILGIGQVLIGMTLALTQLSSFIEYKYCKFY